MQLEGLNWMLNLASRKLNGILADEMGLGKTLQTISVLGATTLELREPKPHLVVVPLSVLGNWQREFAKWCPQLKVVFLVKTSSGKHMVTWVPLCSCT